MTQAHDHVIRINLSTRTVRRERVSEPWRRQFLGGKGLGARYLYEELGAGTNPLEPDNLLGFMLKPLSGYLPGDARYAAITKSPLTGGFLDSYAGGQFPARLAGACADCLGILVTGRADSPVAIRINEDGIEIVSGDHLVGIGVDAVADAFPDAAAACIGSAGESLVRYASIASDGGDHHADFDWERRTSIR